MNKTMRGLDAWLAENVMGWKGDGYCWRDPKLIQPYYRMQASVEDWHPTTNIAQAFELLNKFDYWELYGNEGEGHAAAIWDNKDRRRAVCEQPTATLAICLAAQKAWEAE